MYGRIYWLEFPCCKKTIACDEDCEPTSDKQKNDSKFCFHGIHSVDKQGAKDAEQLQVKSCNALRKKVYAKFVKEVHEAAREQKEEEESLSWRLEHDPALMERYDNNELNSDGDTRSSFEDEQELGDALELLRQKSWSLNDRGDALEITLDYVRSFADWVPREGSAVAGNCKCPTKTWDEIMRLVLERTSIAAKKQVSALMSTESWTSLDRLAASALALSCMEQLASDVPKDGDAARGAAWDGAIRHVLKNMSESAKNGMY